MKRSSLQKSKLIYDKKKFYEIHPRLKKVAKDEHSSLLFLFCQRRRKKSFRPELSSWCWKIDRSMDKVWAHTSCVCSLYAAVGCAGTELPVDDFKNILTM